ncbi:MAG: glucokinase [Halioglobus sp.]|nr:glucokinase [Halioglobus sp.]
MVADVGGTNTRLAAFNPDANLLESVAYYTNSNFECFEDVIAQWLASHVAEQPVEACLAVAAPPTGDRVDMINMDWSFSLSGLAARFGFDRLGFLNDFEANAYALPHLAAAELAPLATGERGAEVFAVVGPGTGLGGSALIRGATGDIARACEPGSAGLSPANELELELFTLLLKEHRDVYAELLLSGPGLARLYRALAQLQGTTAEDFEPAEISRRALAGECTTCASALDTFCALLGSCCADFVLSNGAYGGLYLAGGIAPRIRQVLERGAFNRRFEEKGLMTPLLQKVPRYIITGNTTGLIGAAHAPLG